jgi:hypothetical protein
MTGSTGIVSTGLAGPSEILTVKEVATELRCSRAQVHKLINGQVPGIPQLPSIPLGKRKKVVMRGSLEAWKRAAEIARIDGTMSPDSGMNAVDAVKGSHA